MKRFLVSVLLLVCLLKGIAQSRYWIGPSGGLWSSSANWSISSGGAGGASSPTTANDIIFDNGFNGVVDMDILSATTFTVNSLLLSGNSNVTLQRTQPGGGSRILQLASTSSIIKGLKIDNGSTLIIDGVNTSGTLNYILALTGNAGVTGEISGNLYIKGSGTGAGSAEIDLYDDGTHFAALVVKNTGVIKYFDNTGNTSPGTGSYLTMESGSVYEIARNGGSFPDADWAANSLAKITGMTGNVPSFNGTAYGDLEWNCPGQTAAATIGKNISFNDVNLISTGFPTARPWRIKGGSLPDIFTITVNGNLILSANSIIEISGSTPLDGGGILQVKGNIINNGIVREVTTGLTNRLELIGNSNQNISGNGTLVGSELVVVINNPDSIILNSPLTLPGNLSLVNGTVITSSTNILTIIDGATATGGSSSSFIEGPMKKIGNTDFTFPIGKGSMYAPLGISGATGSPSDFFIAEYKRANPQSTGPYGPNVGVGLNHVSYVEYWTLDTDDGVGSKKISLGIHELSFCKLLSSTYVGYWNASVWNKLNTSIAAGPFPLGNYVTGTIITNDLFDFETSGSRYTFSLVTDLPFNNNPLPIDLISFHANKINNKKGILNWELAACCSPGAKFEIERAGDDRRFKTIATIKGSEINRFYSAIDNDLQTGINYYRLKMTNIDGRIIYSRIEAILNGIKGLYITSLSPNPASSKTIISIVSDTERSIEILIIDMQGHLVRKEQRRLSAGNNTITLLMDGLISGVYQVGVSSEGKTNVISLVKE